MALTQILSWELPQIQPGQHANRDFEEEEVPISIRNVIITFNPVAPISPVSVAWSQSASPLRIQVRNHGPNVIGGNGVKLFMTVFE